MSDRDDGLTAEQAEETTVDRPEWLPESFDKPEDLAKSYGELQRKLGEQGSELARLRPLEERLDEMQELLTQQQTPQQQFDPMQHPLIAGAQQALDNGDVVGLMAAFQQIVGSQQQPAPQEAELDPFLVQQVHESVASRYQADDSMREEALKIMESDPMVSNALAGVADNPRSTAADLVPIVDAAYRLAGSARASAEQQSLAQQQAQQEAARQRKIEQESLTGAGPTRTVSPNEQAEAWERIKNADDGRMPRIQAG